MKKMLLVSAFEKFGEKLDSVLTDLSRKDVVCIPTAAYAYESYDWLEAELIPVRDRAKDFTMFDVAGKTQAEVADALLSSRAERSEVEGS